MCGHGPKWLWLCGCLLCGCGSVAVSCMVIVDSCFLGSCAFEWSCHFVSPVSCCLPRLFVTCWVTVVVWDWPWDCGFVHGCNISTEPVWAVLCVSVCVHQHTSPYGKVWNRHRPHADTNPHSPSVSSSSQWLGLRFSRLLGKMPKGPAGPM